MRSSECISSTARVRGISYSLGCLECVGVR
jgi:hypothetical protein